MAVSFPESRLVWQQLLTILQFLEGLIGNDNLQIVQSCVLSEVIGIVWAVHHVGACAAHMLSKSGVRVFIVVQMHIISRHTHKPNLELQIVIVCP